jgi:hypothetical protein
VEKWTSSLEDIHVNHLAMQVKGKEQKTNDTSGHSLEKESDKCNQQCASGKMLKDTLRLDSTQSSATWKKMVTDARGEYSQRVKLAVSTKGKGSLSWPTIRTSEYKDVGPIGSKSHNHMLKKGYLCAKVTEEDKQWLTPAVVQIQRKDFAKREEYRKSIGRQYVPGSLEEQLQMYPNGTTMPSLSTQVKQELNWPTAKTSDGIGGTPLTEMTNKGFRSLRVRSNQWFGAKLKDAVETLHNQPDQDNNNTGGNHQELSEQTAKNWQTFAPGTNNRGMIPHRQVVKALVNGEKVQTQMLTVDQVFAEEIKSQTQWRTPTAQEAGAKVETLYTKDGKPATPGQRAYRKTPKGEMVLQSATLNQQVEMVDKKWATPAAYDWNVPETKEAWEKRAMTQKEKGINLHLPLKSQVIHDATKPQAMRLNPRWVEILMGLPVGWCMPSCVTPWITEQTNSVCLEMGSSQPQQLELF